LSDTFEDVHERIVTFTSGRISYGYIYTKSFYMLGKIYEEQGNIAKPLRIVRNSSTCGRMLTRG
jgi:hypothetical protein